MESEKDSPPSLALPAESQEAPDPNFGTVEKPASTPTLVLVHPLPKGDAEELEMATQDLGSSAPAQGVSTTLSNELDSQTLQDLNVVRSHLNLQDAESAVSIAARLAAFLFREVQRGGSILIEHRSGARSKVMVSEV